MPVNAEKHARVLFPHLGQSPHLIDWRIYQATLAQARHWEKKKAYYENVRIHRTDGVTITVLTTVDLVRTQSPEVREDN